MIHHYIPRGQLARFIDVFWLTDDTYRHNGLERVLPTGTMQIIINLHDKPMLTHGRGDRRQPEAIKTAIVSGVHMDYVLIDTQSIIRCLGIVFKPGGGAPFFSLPLTEMRNLRIPLDAVWGAENDELRERLLEAGTPQGCFKTLERFLLQKLNGGLETTRATHPFIRHTVKHLRLSPGDPCLDRLKEQSGYGDTRFIKLFSNGVGLTPKQFFRIQRFQKVLNAVFHSRDVDWADLAQDFGYYDQAHFIHEFKAFTGITPGNYFSKRIDDLNHLSH